MFLAPPYDLLAQTQKFKKHYKVRLNSECQADLEWWVSFSRHWNGASILRPVRESCPDVHFWSDASGPWGCGAVWFQVAWDLLPIASASIPSKEVSPIVVAGAIWGRQWKGAMVCDHCDNAAVVAVINSGRAKDPLLAHQLRALFYVCAFEIRWSCSWDSAEPGHVGDRQIGRPGSPTLSLGFSSDNSIRAYTSAQARYNTPNFARPLTYLRFH